VWHYAAGRPVAVAGETLPLVGDESARVSRIGPQGRVGRMFAAKLKWKKPGCLVGWAELMERIRNRVSNFPETKMNRLKNEFEFE
jgi:hypothetical protein